MLYSVHADRRQYQFPRLICLTTPSHTHIPHSCKYVGLSWLSPKGNVGLGLYPHGPLTIDAHRLTDRYAALFPKAYPARRFGRVCVCAAEQRLTWLGALVPHIYP